MVYNDEIKDNIPKEPQNLQNIQEDFEYINNENYFYENEENHFSNLNEGASPSSGYYFNCFFIFFRFGSMTSLTSSPHFIYENNETNSDVIDYANIPTTSKQAYRFQNKLVPTIPKEQIIIVGGNDEEEENNVVNYENTLLQEQPRKRGRRSKVI